MKTDPIERSRPRKRIPRAHPLLGGAVLALWLAPLYAAAQSSNMAGDSAGGSPWAWTALGWTAALLLNALYVAGDTAFDLIRPQHGKLLESRPEKMAVLDRVLERRSKYVAACFIGSHTMRSLLILLCFVPAFRLGEALAASTRIPSGHIATLVAAALLSIPIAALNLVFGELIPKAFGARHPIWVTLGLYPFVRVTAVLLAAPSAVVTWVGGLVTRRFGARATFAVANQAEEQIKDLLDTAQESGEIPQEEKRMVHSVFEFGDTVVREVMTPRVDLDTLPATSTLAEGIELIASSGHSRIPVYDNSDDEIVGIVHAKDVLLALASDPAERPLSSIMRGAVFVPENKPIRELLNEMRTRRNQMVIVQDEFGGTAGVVTIEDIVEEVMGEIIDEYDAEEPPVVKVGEGVLVKGKTNLWDVNEVLGSNFESDEFDTIAGYVFGLFGYQPGVGESIVDSGYRIKVTDSDGRRILRLLVEAEPEEQASDGEMATGVDAV